MTQHDKLKRLLSRKSGCTSVDICAVLPSVSPHRRLSDLKEQGWTIKFKQDGRLKRYFGIAPKAYQ
jgi:hypothetical protein